MLALTGLLVPFAGTTAGAAAVFIMRREMPQWSRKPLLGFASGVMIAASVWSLLLPAIEMSQRTALPQWLPAAAGFMAGILLFLLLDSLVPHRHIDAAESEGPHFALNSTTKLMLAVTLHNIPEGIAVGVVLAGALNGNAGISAAAAMALSAGIAIQNIPEGAIISMPMSGDGYGRVRSFICVPTDESATAPPTGSPSKHQSRLRSSLHEIVGRTTIPCSCQYAPSQCLR